MKKLFFGMLLFSILPLSSQTITVTNSYRLFDGEQRGFNPVLNADGNMLAFTSEGFGGLKVFNFSDNSVITVSDGEGAGFDPVFGEDNRIFFRTNVYKSRLRHIGVNSFDLQTGNIREVFEPRRNLQQLQGFDNGVMVADGDRLLRASLQRSEAVVVPPYVWSDGQNLNIQRNGRAERLNPIEGAGGYIWTSLSPNGQMILSHAVGIKTFVSDLNGNVIATFGELLAPVWYGNDFVVGMYNRDDGRVITESQIIMKSLNGNVSQQLSPSDKMAMYPAASATANRIVYTTDDGEMYVLELSITR